jgi:N-acyl-D-amino-acid deacylase
MNIFDVLIKDGLIFDGTGAPPVKSDIGVVKDAIADIGDLTGTSAEVMIAATGKYVCPGFIDVHSHSDTYLLIEPSAYSKISQGITTEVTGNCGASAAPLTGGYRLPSDWLDKKYPGDWRTMAEYRQLIGQARPAVNVFPLVGHNALRAGVAGYENRPVTAAEIRKMCALLEQAIEEGGHGLSAGLIYSPGMFATTDEIVGLAKVVARRNGIYTSHMRSEGSGLLDAIRETIAIARQAGVKAEISHLKTSGKKNWNLADDAISLIHRAIGEGMTIAADRYPYTSSCTDLDAIFPAWAAEGGHDAVMRRLRSKTERSRLREELLKSRSPDYWPTITIGSTAAPDNRRFQGMPLPAVAAALKMEPVDAALHIVETDELKTSAFFSGMSEKNMLRILAESFVMIGTDASLRAPSGPLSKDYPHPRAYGSFPRFIRMVMETKFITMPDAVRKMTSLPASHFGIGGRGTLRKSAKADIVVFDPESITDTATYAEPRLTARGIDYVLVNGTITVKDGKMTGLRAGRFI